MSDKDKQMFKIKCSPLTPARKKLLHTDDAVSINRPLRIVLAVGGAYIFYYGTKPDVPVMFQTVANIFVVIGIAAVLLAIFSQKLIEIRYFSYTLKKGCFPLSVSIGEGGMFIERGANAERFVAFAQIGRLEEKEAYFKISLLYGDEPGIYIFKEDFEQGDPDDFASFIASKKAQR